MRIFAIDDEQATLDELHDAIAQAEPSAEIMDFRRAADALGAIAEGVRPDVVFSDIQMPGMDGLSFALKLKQALPGVKLIFVTGYEQYALEAFRRRVNGYLMKPVDAAMVREELDALGLPLQAADPEKLLVRCFGWFDVFWHGEPPDLRPEPDQGALRLSRGPGGRGLHRRGDRLRHGRAEGGGVA